MTTGGSAPAASIRFSVSPSAKAMYRLSGDQNGLPYVPNVAILAP